MSTGGPARWERGAVRKLASTRIFDLTGVDYRHPVRGVEREFVVIDAPDWVNVLAWTPEDHLVLVRQFRYGLNEFSWEIPGGVIERGEDPVVAGGRELAEETGFEGRRGRLLASIHPNPAILNNQCHLVLVEGVVATRELAWDTDEEIEIATKPVAEVYAMARRGEITHSLVLNALFWFEPIWRAGGGGESSGV